MSLMEIIGWSAMVVFGLCGSALYSGLETGIYSLNRVRLHILVHQNQKRALSLNRLVLKPTVMLSTLLIGNNITNYMGTAGLTVLLEGGGLTELQVILANLLIVTPMLFVFGETLPKDLFARYSDRLVYRFSGVLTVSRWGFTLCGLLPIVALFSEVLAKLLRSRQHIQIFHPKRQVGVLVKEGVGLGLLSDDQSAMVERVLDLHERQVQQEMTRWEEVETVNVGDSSELLWSLADRASVSRYPVLGEKGDVVGIVSVNDALLYGREQCPPISELMKPADVLDSQKPLLEALNQLQRSHVAMAIVTRADQPIGIVTVKDLVEPITGELTSW